MAVTHTRHRNASSFVLIVALAVLSTSLATNAASINDVCVALKAVSLAPTSQQQKQDPDALDGIAFGNSADLAWVSPSDCEPGSKSLTYTSKPQKNGALCLTQEVDGVKGCTGGEQQDVIVAYLDTTAGTLTASVARKFSFKLVMDGKLEVPVTGMVGFDLVSVPVALLGRVAPVWAGNLTGASGNTLVHDADLFDGVPASVYTGATGKASAETARAMQRAAEYAANVALRVRLFDAVPSALGGDLTARLAFPEPVGLLHVTTNDVTVVGSSAHAAPRATCDGAACGSVVARILQNFAESDGTCGTAKVVHVHGNTGVSIVADTAKKTHRIVSAHAWVQGALECSAGGHVFVTLEALSDKAGTANAYATDVLLEDEHAAMGMAKAVALKLSGSRVALVRKDGHVYTTMEGDLFGFGRGGVFVDDVEISDATKTQFVSAVNTFSNELHTDLSSLNAAVLARLTRVKPEAVFANYMERTATPTGHGLWQYWAKQTRGVEIVMGDNTAQDTLLANVDMTLRGQHLTYNSQEPVFSSMNKVLADTHTQLEGSKKGLKAPVLTESTKYTLSILDGAVSARISIPKLKATRDALPRLYASNVASWAKVTVAATMNDNYTLTNFRLTTVLRSGSSSQPVIEFANTNSKLGDVTPVIARTASGTIILDDQWTAEQIKGTANALASVSTAVSKALSGTVEQLRVVCEDNTATYTQVVDELIKTLKALPANSKAVSGIAEKVRNKLNMLVDSRNTNALIANFGVTPDSATHTLAFDFDFFTIRHIGAEETSGEWQSIVPLARLRVQTPTTSALHFTATPSSAALKQFTQKGTTAVTGWTLPVRSGMRPGSVSGSAKFDVNFPAAAKLVIDATGRVERGDAVTAHFEGNMTVTINDDTPQVPTDLYKWSFVEANRGDYAQAVDPTSVTNGFFDNSIVFRSIVEHRLSSPVPPFAARLGEFFDTSNMWATERAAFYTDSASPVLASAVLRFPTAKVDDEYNFTVNGNVRKSCTMTIPALATSATAQQAYASAISACGLSKYIAVNYVPNSEGDQHQGEQEEGRITLTPASPGIVYSFVVQVAMDTKAPLREQTWSAGQTSPDALSWNDLYDTIYAMFYARGSMNNVLRDDGSGAAYSPPKMESVAVSDLGLVDPSRAEYYPKQLPVMLFPISFRKEATAASVPVASSLRSENLNTQFDLESKGFTLPTAVTGEVSAQYGYALWCSLGDGTLNITTAFLDENSTLDNTVVPPAPLNTFTMEFKYETRSKANVDARPALSTVAQTVTLTPGALVGNELKRLPSLITDERVRRMLVADRVIDTLREPAIDQLSVAFVPLVDAAAGTIAVPLAIAITRSDIPFWGSNESAVSVTTMTTCAVSKDFRTHFTVATAPRNNAEASTPCTGTTGIIEANGTATLSSQQDFVASSGNTFEFLANLVSAAVDSNLFERFFASSADVSTIVDVTGFKFDVDRISLKDIGSQIMRFVRNAKSLPFNNLTSLVDATFITDVITTGASALALKSLSAADRSHVCAALTLAERAASAYTGHSVNTETLPFSDQAMGPAFTQRIGSIVKGVADTICADAGDLTLDPVCKTLSKGWGVQACAEAAIEDNALLLYVTAEPPPFRLDAGFQFDVNRMIPFAKKKYPVGAGTSGDLLILANMTASFGIRFEFGAPANYSVLDYYDENMNMMNRRDFVEDEYYPGQVQEVQNPAKAQLAALTNKWVSVSLDPERTKFYAQAGLDASARLKVSFGSVVLNFASAAVHLDAHVGAQWTEEKKIAFDVDGAASMQAGVSLEPVFSCSVRAEIPSLADFLMRRANATWTEDCGNGKSFLSQLESATDGMNLAKYFAQDPSLFWRQFSQNVDGIFHTLINNLLNRAVAFVGKQIQGLMHKALDGLTGPEVADLVGQEVTDMVAKIILNHTAPTGEDLERIVLQVFTGILNVRFRPILRQDIPTPEPNPADGRYVWQMVFGQTVNKPLANIDFHLGGHGMAQFGLQCQPELELAWTVQIDVVWTRNKGISVEWPDPAFEGSITLNNNDCVMEGRLLFVGAVLKATLTLDIKLLIRADGETKRIEAAEFQGGASMTGEAQLGLVGILRKKTDDSIANSLPVLPHVKAGVEMEWRIDLRTDHKGQDTPFRFEFVEPQVCLGTLITGFLRKVTEQIHKVVKPLLPIFGKDGLLLKKIPQLKPILQNHNDVLGILELMCKFFGSCNVNAVRKLCETIRQVSEVLEKLEMFQQWLSGDDTGCALFDVVFKTFGVNWTSPKPVPINPSSGLALRDWDDDGYYKFPDDFDENRATTLRETVSEWKKGGEFKFTLDILKGFPAKFLQIMLGMNVPLFSLSFPYATFGFSVSWSIPVWHFPYVAIVVYGKASLEFRPPPIALMSNAVMDTIRTKNPSHFFRNFALRAMHDDGQPFFFIKGSITVGGGVEVGVSIFIMKVSGEATIGITFTAGLSVVSINNEAWTTFEQIAMQFRQKGIAGIVDVQLTLTGSFRLALKACVKLFFKKKCWTLASKTWSFTLAKKDFKAWRMPQFANDGGEIDGGSADFNIPTVDPEPVKLLGDGRSEDAYYNYNYYNSREFENEMNLMEVAPLQEVSQYARYTITPSNVMLLSRTQKDADAPRQRQLSTSPSIRFRGNPCSRPISVTVVGDIAFPIQLPNCGNSLLNVSQNNYDLSASSFKIASKTIRAGERPPITFSGAWQTVLLSEAVIGTNYETSGMPPCPVTVETGELSTLSVVGQPADYGSRLLEMTGGLRSVQSTVRCSDFVIDLDKYTCTSKAGGSLGVNLHMPSGVRSFEAYAQTEEKSLFHLIATPEGRDVVLTSATKEANFSVPDMATMRGYTSCNGNPAGSSYLLATMKTLPKAAAQVVISPAQSQLDNGDGATHVVHHTNVPFRVYDVHGAGAQKTAVKVLPPTEFDVVQINSKGAASGEMTHYVTGCHVRSGVQVRLEGAGHHTVVFGDKDGLKGSGCSPSVVAVRGGSNGDFVSEIVVNATRDDRELRWKLLKGKLAVSTRDEQSDTFQILYEKIDRVTVNFGTDASEVLLDTQLDSTEFVLNFQDSPRNRNGAQNTLQVVGAPAAVLVRGPVQRVVVGRPESGKQAPFAELRGMVAVASAAHIVLDTAHGADAPAQHFTMDGRCVTQNGTALAAPSAWMRQQLADAGVPAPAQQQQLASCNLLYNSAVPQSLEVRTGDGADSFTGIGVAIPVTLDMGGNADRVRLERTADVPIVVNLGEGADELTIDQTGDVTADLGNDKNTDSVNVYYHGKSPSISGKTISPVGYGHAVLKIENWLQQDLISVRRAADKRNVNSRFRADYVLIEAVTPGAKLHYEQATDTTYIVTRCASMCNIAFDVYSSAATDFARNAWVIAAVPDYSTTCTLIVNSELAANGTVGVVVPANATAPPRAATVTRNGELPGTGTINVGLLELRPVNISHVELAVPRVNGMNTGTVTVGDVPGGADLLVSVPTTDWTVVLNTLRAPAVIIDATTRVAAQTVSNQVPVMVVGSTTAPPLYVDGQSALVAHINGGCITTQEGPKVRAVSDWLVWRAYTEYGVWVGKQHQCNVELQKISTIFVGNVSQVDVSGLTSAATKHVVVESNKPELQLTVESAATTATQLWKWMRYEANGTAALNRLTVARKEDKDDSEAFVIDVRATNKLMISPGSNVRFADGAPILLDCAASGPDTQLNLSRHFENSVQLRATMTVASSKCNVQINNMVSANTEVAPPVVLADGLSMDLSVLILPPETATRRQQEQEQQEPILNKEQKVTRILRFTTDNGRAKYLLAPALNVDDDSSSSNNNNNNNNNKDEKYESTSNFMLDDGEISVNDEETPLINATWLYKQTVGITHDLRDYARYVLEYGSQIIDDLLVRLNVSADASLAFGNLNGSTVLFTGAAATDFKPSMRSFSLERSGGGGDYCFDPCQDCEEGVWDRVVIAGKMCQPRTAQDSCKSRAKVVVNITGALEGVACGAASWAHNETCAFAMNNDGHSRNTLDVPESVTLATTVVVAVSAGLTVLGATSLLGMLLFSCKGYAAMGAWWAQNTFRDLLTDQFSWAAIVITACLPEASDADYAGWGGPVLAILLRVKTIVLNGFVACSANGEPVWVTPMTIVFWSVTGVSVVMRVIELVLNRRNVRLNALLENTLLAVQSYVTIVGFLLMPIVGHTLAFLTTNTYIGFVSLLCVLLLFLSQPVGKVSRACVCGISASVVNVLLPIGLCIYAGVGARILPLLATAFALALALPAIDLVVLWFAFFRKAVYHNATWKNSLVWTALFRLASMLAGCGFLILLYNGDLDTRWSWVAAGLWFGWVGAPFLAVIPLTLGVPSVLTGGELVSRKGYTEIHDDARVASAGSDDDDDDESERDDL